MKIYRILSIFISFFAAGAASSNEFDKKEVNGILKEIAIYHLQAKYADFLYDTFTDGKKAYKTQINDIDLKGVKVWVESYEKEKVEIFIVVTPNKRRGSIGAVFLNKKDKRWDICQFGVMDNTVEEHANILHKAYDICFGNEL